MGLAVHGDLGQFQINTFLTLKFLPIIDSDWAVTRSHFPTREQCWRVEFLDSTWAANCAGAIVLSLAFHQDIVDFSYFHIECWVLMFGIAGETRGRVPNGGWSAHGFPLLSLGAHLSEQVPRHLLIFTLSMSLMIFNDNTYFARSISYNYNWHYFRFVLDSTLMVDFMPFFTFCNIPSYYYYYKYYYSLS